jgi:hypothetical protein
MIPGGETKDGMDAKLIEHMENLAKGIKAATEKVGAVDAKVDTITADQAALRAKLEADKGDGDADKDDLDALLEDDDDPKKLEERITKNVTAQITNQTTVQRQQEQWDNRAIKEFPDLSDQTSQFYTETKKEVASMPHLGVDKRGIKIYPLDAVYNAAARVKLRGQREGWIPLTMQTEDNLEDGGGFRQRKIKGKQITDIQRDLCDMWKVDQKKVEARIKSR